MPILVINRNYKSFKRFLQIVETALSYGFQDLTEGIEIGAKFRFCEKSGICGKSRPEKLRMLLEEFGPTFVKLGQILSTRSDLLPKEYTTEFSKLTEDVAPFSSEEARKILTEELGKSPDEIFVEFSSEPMAAASIGQVHTAKLKDGTEVVIKIQRPGIQQIIEVDLEIMLFIASKLEQHNEVIAKFHPVRIVKEFAYQLKHEMNYQFESSNLLRFRKNMKDSQGLVTPNVYLEYTTQKVLTMERIFGVSATKVLASEELAKKFNLQTIATNGVNSLLEQIFVHGFFHADPHPGNIFLMEPDVLSFIDFGMMGRVSETDRANFMKILDYMLRGQIGLMTDAALRLTITGTPAGDREELVRDITDLVDENINLPLERLSVAHILQELMILINHYELALKPDLYLMFKALISIEHVGRSFYPELKIIEMVKPFIRKLKFRKMSPIPFIRRFFDELDENMDALQNLPKTVRTIMKKAEHGDLTVRIEHHRLDEIEQTLYVTGVRMSRSMLVMSLVIGSALVIVAKVPPFWNDIPVFGVAGFLISGFLSALVLLDDHFRRRKFLQERARRKRMQQKRD